MNEQKLELSLCETLAVGAINDLQREIEQKRAEILHEIAISRDLPPILALSATDLDSRVVTVTLKDPTAQMPEGIGEGFHDGNPLTS